MILFIYHEFGAMRDIFSRPLNMEKPVLTEKSLRAVLDKMQVSLLNYNGEEIYLRSAPAENEGYLQQKVGVKPLPSIISPSKLIL